VRSSFESLLRFEEEGRGETYHVAPPECSEDDRCSPDEGPGRVNGEEEVMSDNSNIPSPTLDAVLAVLEVREGLGGDEVGEAEEEGEAEAVEGEEARSAERRGEKGERRRRGERGEGW
jgi:hypothetical protein